MKQGGEFWVESAPALNKERTQCRPFVKITASEPVVLSDIEDATALALNIVGGIEAAVADAKKVQAAIDRGDDISKICSVEQIS